MFRMLKSLVLKMLSGPTIRPMIKAVKQQNKRLLVGVEIGVEEGYNAKSILNELHIAKLFLVDPYQPYQTTYGNFSDRNYDMFNRVMHDLAKYGAKVAFVRKTSEEAIHDIPNGLDFVYIDGNHDYEYVKKDIELYYPKVKLGGIIGGHDFRVTLQGVCRAVLEFASKNHIQLHGENVDWWIIK